MDFTPPAIALNRFGLGHRNGDAVPSEPRAWLRRQITAYRPFRGEMAQADYGAERVQELVATIDDARAARKQVRKANMEGSAEKLRELAREMYQDGRTIYQNDAAIRVRAAVDSPTPFMERLVHFWSNHFAVSKTRARIANLVGTYEFGAIRPNITGSFADLLRAASLHPAMLFYLDQANSIGPDSPLLQRRRMSKHATGLNENLGREILELHTLGVGGGYTQTDVLELARALTGWVSLGGAGAYRGKPMQLGAAFDANLHQPGSRRVLGKTYPEGGAEQALAILDDLAQHPATARHIATKLARHFAGDTPPPAMVARLERRYLDSKGDLSALYLALIESPEAWVSEPVKVRQPFEWTVALLRAAGDQVVADWRLAEIMNELGQPTWSPNSPAGWDDLGPSWLGPDALLRRVRAAQIIANKTRLTDVRALAQAMFPQSLSANTEAYLRGAESNQMALALLAVSPEMLRR